MPGISSKRVAYLGKEVTPGTAVTPTWAWSGESMGMPDDKRKVVKIETQEGVLGGINRSAVSYIESSINFGETPFTFEQFPYLMSGGFGGPVANATKTYLTTFPTTGTVPTYASAAYTIRAGDDYEQDLMTAAVASGIKIQGKQKELVKMGCKWQAGNIIQATGAAPTVTLPLLEYLPFGATKTYIDPVTGTYGGTQVPGMVLGFDIEFEPHWEDKNPSDGQLFKSFSVFTKYDIKGKITVEQDSLASRTGGFRSYLVSQTPILLHIIGEGSVISGAGTYTKKTLIIDLPIKIDGAPSITDIGGNDIVEFTFWSQYDITKGDAGKVICVNNLLALP